MKLDLEIDWNDLSKECQDKIKKLHKNGFRVNIKYPKIDNDKTDSDDINKSNNIFWDSTDHSRIYHSNVENSTISTNHSSTDF